MLTRRGGEGLQAQSRADAGPQRVESSPCRRQHADRRKALFRALVDEDATFRNEVFGVFAARLCFLMTLIEEMAITRLDERLADLLISRGPVILATHQALADELGTAREVVSRILEHFEDTGLVRLRRARVDVLDPRHLAHMYASHSIE